MLRVDENELLTRTGRGTPMGTYMRRFWTPVMLASELSGPDSAPVRVQILGEKLVAFCDSEGRIGLLAAYCPHRRANLFWGRNEESGLRCVYHGWKFDVAGRCLDIPNCPEGDSLRSRVTTTAYPTRIQGGIVWAYLGPPELEPPFPNIEIFTLPDARRKTFKIVCDGSYLDHMEGDMDASHASILHSRLDGGSPEGTFSFATQFADSQPRYFIDETPYGLRLAARRDAGADAHQWRVTQYFLPYCSLLGSQRGTRYLSNMRVPIDDVTSLNFRTFAHPERPLREEDYGGVIMPEFIEGTFRMKENLANDFLIDRDDQRTRTFTGIKSFVAEDFAVIGDRGTPIARRDQEYLVSSDRAIIALRKRLLTGVKNLSAGREPPEARDPEAFRVRSIDIVLPRDAELRNAAPELYSPDAIPSGS
jgi:nitrite reductase/ring-hydroxylating ferredoxin subunit